MDPKTPAPDPSKKKVTFSPEERKKLFFELREQGISRHLASSRSLRIWFITYGIGAPLILISRDWIFYKVKDQGMLPWIIASFLTGLLLQIIAELTIKLRWDDFQIKISEKSLLSNSNQKLWENAWKIFHRKTPWVDFTTLFLFSLGTALFIFALTCGQPENKNTQPAHSQSVATQPVIDQ